MKKIKIIVHPGGAHLDDFVTCAEALVAVVLKHRGMVTLDEVVRDTLIQRREPTKAELDDPEVLVADVGGRYEVDKNNFDHHQLPVESEDCAMTLFAKSVCTRKSSIYCFGETLFDVMSKIFPWYETRAFLDSNGPYKAADRAGVKWGQVVPFGGPFEEMILDRFENCTADVRAALVAPLAKKILDVMRILEKVKVATRFVGGTPKFAAIPPTIICVYDFTQNDPDDVDIVSDILLKDKEDGVAIFKDKRGPGWGLLRLRDDPRIDFNLVREDPRMNFVHANGFYATTKEPLPIEEVCTEIIYKAKKPVE